MDIQFGAMDPVSVSPEGGLGDNHSGEVSVSYDGSRIAFSSSATNLVPEDDNVFCPWGGGSFLPLSYVNCRDIFLWDSENGVRLVSRADDGGGTDNKSIESVISGNGRWIAYYSFASNIDPRDTDHYKDLYLYDIEEDESRLISVSKYESAWQRDKCQTECGRVSTSHDGRFVVFDTLRNDLVEGDTNSLADMYLYDRDQDRIELITVGVEGKSANGASWSPSTRSISADGRFIVFQSYATNLVENETVGDRMNIYLFDRKNAAFQLITRSAGGGAINADAGVPIISNDGRYVSYMSTATNIVSGAEPSQGNVYLFDRLSARTSLISATSAGQGGNGHSLGHDMSGDGRFIVFNTYATNLGAGDQDGLKFALWDSASGRLMTIDYPLVDSGEIVRSGLNRISGDGSLLVFRTKAADSSPFNQVYRMDLHAPTEPGVSDPSR